MLDGGPVSGRGTTARPAAPGNGLLEPSLLEFLEERPVSTGSQMVLNSTSSIKSTSSSSDQPIADSGLRLAQELAEHLSSLTGDERKKLIATFLNLVDEDSLTVFSSRLEAEKKSRKKGKESSKSRARSGAKEVNGQLGSPCSSSVQSVEVVAESSHIPAQTSPTAASRKTFAGESCLETSNSILLFILSFPFPPFSLLIPFFFCGTECRDTYRVFAQQTRQRKVTEQAEQKREGEEQWRQKRCYERK